jgi:hypothetical protein
MALIQPKFTLLNYPDMHCHSETDSSHEDSSLFLLRLRIYTLLQLLHGIKHRRNTIQ